jgi:hypothetical protein
LRRLGFRAQAVEKGHAVLSRAGKPLSSAPCAGLPMARG